MFEMSLIQFNDFKIGCKSYIGVMGDTKSEELSAGESKSVSVNQRKEKQTNQ